MTLTEFILARIDEDEQIARAPVGRMVTFHNVDKAAFRHIHRWSSSRVLAECAVKRRIVERITEGCPHPPRVGGWCMHCDSILGDLASVHADHPDYRAEWGTTPAALPQGKATL